MSDTHQCECPFIDVVAIDTKELSYVGENWYEYSTIFATFCNIHSQINIS